MNLIERFKPIVKKYALLLGVAAFALIAAFLYINKYLYRLFAVVNYLNVTASPATGNFPVNQNQTVDFILQPQEAGKKISGFDITFVSTGGIEFVDASTPASFPGGDTTVYMQVAKQVNPTSLRLYYITLKTPAELEDGVRLTLTYKGTTQGSGSISINQAISNVVGNVDPDQQAYTFSPSAASGNFTFSGPTPNLSFSPTTGNYTVGQQFDVQVLLDTAGSNVSNTDAVISYDINALRAVSVTPGTIFYSYTGIGGGSNYIDDVNGKIKIGAGIEPQPTPIPVNGSGLQFATITFEALNPTTTNVTFDFTLGDRNDSNIVESLTDNDILAAVTNAQFTLVAGPTPTAPPVTGTPVPTPTATPVPTSTPVPTATPVPPTSTPVPTTPPTPITLNLTIVLEGRTWLGATQIRNVDVSIKNTAITANITTNAVGQASNISLPGLTAGTYTILVKPEGFLQRAVTMNLATGSNDLDMTATLFLAGDINNDNFINNTDYIPMLSGYFLSQTVIQPFGTDGDFDGSGQINGLDFSLMLKNWFVAGEE